MLWGVWNQWGPYIQAHLRLVVVPQLEAYGPPSLQSWPWASDFYHFGSLKTCNTCWREATCRLSTDPDTSLFWVGMQALVAWWDMCLKVHNNSVQVWYVPSATHTPCVQWSYNKVLDISVFVTLFLKQRLPYKMKQYHFGSGYWTIFCHPIYTPLKITGRKFGKDKKKSTIHYVTELCDSLTTCVRECLCRLCFWENSLLHTLQIYCFSLLWVCWWDARCPLLEKALLHMSHL